MARKRAKKPLLTGDNRTTANRDEHGRFVKGASSPNPNGRPSLAAELPLIEGIKVAVSAEKVAQALEKLFAMGIGGDTKALTAWLGYAVGKPVERVDMTSGGKELGALTADRLLALSAIANSQVNAWKEERFGNGNNRTSSRAN